MALRKLTPQHRVDARIVFIPETDDAWDLERFERECKAMRDAGQDPEDHPLRRYWDGKTRYDIEARDTVLGSLSPPSSYLRSAATRFVLRRMSPREFAGIADTIIYAQHRAYHDAVTRCLESIEDPTVSLELERQGGVLDERSQTEILDTWGARVFWDIGLAAIRASGEASPAEKKPSVSSPGATSPGNEGNASTIPATGSAG